MNVMDMKDFISQMRSSGKPDEETVQSLRSAGWSEKDVVAAMSETGVTFFAPRLFWDILVAIPLAYIVLLVLFLPSYILSALSIFSTPFSAAAAYERFASLERSVAFFWVAFPIHFIVAAIIILDIVYLFINRQKIAATSEMLAKWIALVVFFGPFAILYAHFRYLRGRSSRKCVVLVGSAAAVVLAITTIQTARIFTAVSQYQRKVTPLLDLVKEPEFKDKVRELIPSEKDSSPFSTLLAPGESLETSFYESSDIGNASIVRIRLPKGWFADVWGSIPNLMVVMKPEGYAIKEYSFPFVDINIVQVGTKWLSVISEDNTTLMDKWITNNDVLPPGNGEGYSINVLNREYRKFITGYGLSNAYYVEFDMSFDDPRDTKDGKVKNLKFVRALVEAKHPNFAFDIKVVDAAENWGRNKDIIYRSLATLTGRGSVESGEGL